MYNKCHLGPIFVHVGFLYKKCRGYAGSPDTERSRPDRGNRWAKVWSRWLHEDSKPPLMSVAPESKRVLRNGLEAVWVRKPCTKNRFDAQFVSGLCQHADIMS